MTRDETDSRAQAWSRRGWIALILTSAFFGGPSCGATDSTAERNAAEFLRLFNAGDRDAYEGFLRSRWPAFKDADAFAQMRDQTGGYVLVEPSHVFGDEAREIVKSRLADDYWSFDIQMAAGPYGEIRRLAFTPTERPTGIAAPARVPPTAIGRFVDGRIAALGDFSGVAAIGVDGQAIYSRAAGLADKERRVPNTSNTRFGMASMGKMFTAVAIMQLVQDGRVGLDAPVGAYIADYPNAEFARLVTLRELLTHTGGAGDFFSKLWADNVDHLKSPADYVALFGGRPPGFKPGSRFSYANYGFVVLGRIVEEASGQSYDDYLERHVFGPAHMTSTGLRATDPRPAALAYVKDGYPAPPPGMMTRPSRDATPAGGAFTTAPDMLAFAAALTGHRLLDRTHTSMLFTPQVQGDSGPVGFGFQIFDQDGVRWIGHDGGGPGENGSLRFTANGRAVVVVLSNVAPSWRGDKLCAFITARLSIDRS